ncbi:MAG: hypothetical protein EBV45_06110 [Chloroflexi bacterium]|nr:hypothetical protein [Chloroflexota bacterium]
MLVGSCAVGALARRLRSSPLDWSSIPFPIAIGRIPGIHWYPMVGLQRFEGTHVVATLPLVRIGGPLSNARPGRVLEWVCP